MTGPRFLRYGGNTTSLEITNIAGDRLLIDLGTGVTALGKQLMLGEFGHGHGNATCLLTHTHLNHIQGMPFFSPCFMKGNSLRILGHEREPGALQRVFQTQLNPHYSPLGELENLAADVRIEPVAPGSSWPVEGFEVSAALVPHGGMNTMGFRIVADGRTLCFLTDVEYPEGVPTAEALALAKAADLLIHDAMLSDEAYPASRGWGHSSLTMAQTAAQAAGARMLALFHHSPDADDDAVDALVEQGQARSHKFPVVGASENVRIEV